MSEVKLQDGKFEAEYGGRLNSFGADDTSSCQNLAELMVPGLIQYLTVRFLSRLRYTNNLRHPYCSHQHGLRPIAVGHIQRPVQEFAVSLIPMQPLTT